MYNLRLPETDHRSISTDRITYFFYSAINSFSSASAASMGGAAADDHRIIARNGRMIDLTNITAVETGGVFCCEFLTSVGGQSDPSYGRTAEFTPCESCRGLHPDGRRIPHRQNVSARVFSYRSPLRFAELFPYRYTEAGTG